RKDDRFAQRRAVADPRAVTDRQRADQPRAGADRDVAPDPDRSVERLRAVDRRALADGDAGGDLGSGDLDPQLPGERVEGSLAQLGERADVVPVLLDLVDEEGHALCEQYRKDVLRPIDERR